MCPKLLSYNTSKEPKQEWGKGKSVYGRSNKRTADFVICTNFESPTTAFILSLTSNKEAIAAPPTVMNAVIDALGGQEITMPATAEKVWKACKNLKKSNSKAA